ncbi:2-phospho-L-lactate guanylyltransferase [Rhodopseudomonas sp. NSM]|uniref:2-phospho-L-lactate guanylyltransferase n=1 Tax=Rhodopseudomonas sp. NSM TaxID=3457630 RepID=UPI0040373CB8
MTHVLIPCKPFELGKSRLAGALDAVGRKWLCERMLRQTLAAAVAAFGAEYVSVVSAAAQVRRMAASFAAATIDDSAGDLNAALAAARDRLLSRTDAPARLMILPIDLPYVEAETLRGIATAEAPVVIVPDRKFDGTNLLCIDRAIAEAFRFGYGPGSFQRHFKAGQTQGTTPAVVIDQRLAFDLDEPDDYRRWVGDAAA